ncbi:lysozyme inhibitor LprI family protein [Cupriavidus necator]|uniref:lysozyme inhibitor LprI family protein n=1 Tax=Cupriavidus necator TaxID=106590 RepID=UPI0005B4AEB9|nr:lysozyme inhibitor LprI family protein [Cupriavidus necator]
MRAIACLAILTLAAAFAPASATESSGLSAEYERCMAKAVSTADMLGCTSAELRQQDTALNTAYQGLLRRLVAPRTGLLRVAQREWLRFREANCAYMADPAGGTAARVTGASCMARMTAARARELRAYGDEAGAR